jgi:hypothetical protein
MVGMRYDLSIASVWHDTLADAPLSLPIGQTHNPKVAGSNPTPAPILRPLVHSKDILVTGPRKEWLSDLVHAPKAQARPCLLVRR